jgi:aryl-alcohol dehydrogenase-like predicted oxidoreductase
VQPPRTLGKSGIQVPAIGVGTNKWGASGKGSDVIAPLFDAALDAGANLIDTAEMYQFGKSERVIGDCLRKSARPAIVIDKFTPWPTRFSSKTLPRALDASLDRLGTRSVDVYMIHFPFTFLSIDTMLDLIAEAVRAGKVRAVGVSNFDARQMEQAAERLARHNLPLAANEVSYSLVNRKPEGNGVLEACRKLDVALIAYRPLANGRVFAGKLGEKLTDVGRALGKTASQVAIAWLLRRDQLVIAIPGASSVAHLRENCDPLGWTLGDEHFAALDQASR